MNNQEYKILGIVTLIIILLTSWIMSVEAKNQILKTENEINISKINFLTNERDQLEQDLSVLTENISQLNIKLNKLEEYKSKVSELYSNIVIREGDVILDFINDTITIDDTTYTREDIEILLRVIESEATSGSIIQKSNVAHTVFNRLKSPYFPNTIEDVIFQRNAFSVIGDGRFYSISITESTKQALSYVLQGYNSHDGTFFMARGLAEKSNITWFDTHLTVLFEDGIHEYFKMKGR